MARKKVGKSPATDPRPIRILHLSDFHLDAERRWDSDPVLKALAKIIAEEITPAFPPDVVAITGDVADKGKPTDYTEARRWIDDGLLKALPPEFPRSKILVVPGNHDVDRKSVKAGAKALQSGLLV